MAGSKNNVKDIVSVYKNPISYANFESYLNSSSFNFLTNPSLNVLIRARKYPNYVSWIEKREGYKKVKTNICCGKEALEYGNNNLNGKYRFDTNRNRQIQVRHYGNNMIVSDNMIDWIQIGETDYTLVNYEWNYTTVEDHDINRRVMVFVNGQNTNEVFRWDGRLSRVTSKTATSITIDLEDFVDSQEAGKLWIGCNEYTYSKIEKTTIYISDTSNIAIGCLVTSPIEKRNLVNHTQISGDNFHPDLVTTFDNHVFYVDRDKSKIFVSKGIGGSDWYDLKAELPSTVKDGYAFTTDNIIVGIYSVKNGVLIGCKNNTWHYITNKQVDITQLSISGLNIIGEQPYIFWSIYKITSGDQQGLKHQWLGRIGDNLDLMYISSEPRLNLVDWGATITANSTNYNGGRDMADSNNRNMIGGSSITNLSALIKNDFAYIEKNGYWEWASMLHYQDHQFICLPKLGRTYMYNTEIGFWQPPQTLNMGAYTIHDNKLYGYNFNNTNVYEMFIGYNDDDLKYECIVSTYLDSMETVFHKKKEDHFFVHASASYGAEFNTRLNYDFGETGRETNLFFSATPQHKYNIQENAQSLPKTSGDKYVFDIHSDNMDDNKYMAQILGNIDIQDNGNSYYSRQIIIQENKKDTRWSLFQFGTNATLSNESDVSSQMFGENLGNLNDTYDYNDPMEC